MPNKGTIHLNDKPILGYELRKYTILCSQNPHLFSMELTDNINFSNIITKDHNYINYVYKALGINDFINKSAIELSGGQYHRIALARALISEAKLYIFDEPTASIDKERRK